MDIGTWAVVAYVIVLVSVILFIRLRYPELLSEAFWEKWWEESSREKWSEKWREESSRETHAEVLTTRKENVEAIEDIIRSSKEKVVLISPFLTLPGDFRQLIEAKCLETDIKVDIVHDARDQEIDRWLESVSSVSSLRRKDFHSKIYLNEDKALVTSQNLTAIGHEEKKRNGDTRIPNKRRGTVPEYFRRGEPILA